MGNSPTFFDTTGYEARSTGIDLSTNKDAIVTSNDSVDAPAGKSSSGESNNPPNPNLAPVMSTNGNANLVSHSRESLNASDSNSIMLLCRRIANLVAKNGDGMIQLSRLSEVYFSEYGTNFSYDELKNVLDDRSSLIVVRGGGDQSYVATKHKNMMQMNDFIVSVGNDASQKSMVNKQLDEAKYLKRFASELSPKHSRICDFRSFHPDGTSVNYLTKSVEGLGCYLQYCAKKSGKEYMAPAPAKLPNHCDVSCKTVAGQNSMFVSDKVSTEGNVLRYGGQDTPSDWAAAIELLKLMKQSFQNRPWPTTMKELKRKMISMKRIYSPMTEEWLNKGIKPEITQTKRHVENTRRAMQKLKKLGCLFGTNNALLWDLERVNALCGLDLSTEIHLPSSANTENRTNGENVLAEDVNLSAGAPQPTGSKIENMSTKSPLPTRTNIDSTAENVNFVDSADVLKEVMSIFPFNPTAAPKADDDLFVAVDCEGVPDNLYLIQVGTCSSTFLFDCVKLGAPEVVAMLRPFFTGRHVTKLFHDLHNDSAALYKIGGIESLCQTLDTQLAIEVISGDLHIGFNQMLLQLGQDIHPLKSSVKKKMDDGQVFAQRPLPQDVLDYAALDVSLLMRARESLFEFIGSTKESVQRASDMRATMASKSKGLRQICFDAANNYSIASFELIQELRPKDCVRSSILKISDDTEVLLRLLPEDIKQNLIDQTQALSDIVLDKGRQAHAWIDGVRVHLGSERTVSQEDINEIVEKLGGFGSDNRAGLERQLHRVSAIRNRQEDIIGLTLRVGRHVSGNATMISDLMFADNSQSILFLGEPGAGKTTVVREVTRQLAERFNVCIVDTSNEIAGDGDIPHPCVGHARRMMVPNLDKQRDVMIECVQNHTPEVMVIDEIGRPTEVEAARTCKQRGVRLVASAHGDLRKLIKNTKLRGLIGGIETVILGDAEAKRAGRSRGGLQKLKAQREGPPVFDVIVELRRGAQHEWRIIMDVGEAVDRVLEGRQYNSQRRIRDPETGSLAMELEKA